MKSASADLVTEVDRTSRALRASGRELSGIGGVIDRRPLRVILRESHVSFYPLMALFALGASQTIQSAGGTALQPEIAATLGVGPSFLVLMGVMGQVVGVLVPLGTSFLVQARPVRAVVAIVCGLVWAMATISAGFIPSAAFLALYLLVDTVTTGAADTVQVPLLLDHYPPHARVRTISFLVSATIGASLLGPALTAGLTGIVHLTWRGVFLVTGVLSLGAALFASRLRDPGYGRWDEEVVREAVRSWTGEDSGATGSRALLRPRFGEVYRRLWAIRTLRRSMIGAMVTSMAAPLTTYLVFFYDQSLGFDPAQRSLLTFASGAAALVSLLVLGKYGDRLFQKDPRLVFWGGAGLSAIGSLFTVIVVYSGSPSAAVIFAILSAAMSGVLGPASMLGSIAIIPAHLRHYSGALFAIFGVFGYAFGGLFLAGIGDSYGLQAAIAALAVPQVIGAAFVGFAGHTFVDDLDRVNEEIIEEQAIAGLVQSGRHLPMLACRGLDFSYGPVQVLFDVDFTVEDGEMVALLGVNGAGKSTLLRVVSGLAHSDQGSIRFDGHDVTYVDAERRARLGITQVPGGRAVFPELSVVENLKIFGYSYARERRRLSDAIESCLEVFPQLAARRDQPAAVLSGGERQMLGMSKAFVARPRLLLLDELTLGLSPVVVGQLIEMVRQINAGGTSVVVVEQSVNIALTLSEHAYFMERGRVVFNGASAQLLDRDDLLRSVFFAGAAQTTFDAMLGDTP